MKNMIGNAPVLIYLLGSLVFGTMGCSTLHMQVSAVAAPPLPKGTSCIIVPKIKDLAENTALYSANVKYLVRILERRGYQVVEDPAKATITVVFNYGAGRVSKFSEAGTEHTDYHAVQTRNGPAEAATTVQGDSIAKSVQPFSVSVIGKLGAPGPDGLPPANASEVWRTVMVVALVDRPADAAYLVPRVLCYERDVIGLDVPHPDENGFAPESIDPDKILSNQSVP